jgi:hypothetical protein
LPKLIADVKFKDQIEASPPQARNAALPNAATEIRRYINVAGTLQRKISK